jgi:hypothetical protein
MNGFDDKPIIVEYIAHGRLALLVVSLKGAHIGDLGRTEYAWSKGQANRGPPFWEQPSCALPGWEDTPAPGQLILPLQRAGCKSSNPVLAAALMCLLREPPGFDSVVHDNILLLCAGR